MPIINEYNFLSTNVYKITRLCRAGCIYQMFQCGKYKVRQIVYLFKNMAILLQNYYCVIEK